MDRFPEIKALTFDVFGTVLDLGGSLKPFIGDFLKSKGSDVLPQDFWDQWRSRQRIEQYQDTMLALGHSGYLETARRGFVWTLELYSIQASIDEVKEFMTAWDDLSPFPEVVPALERLKTRFKLVALSNGDVHYLDHVTQNRIQWDFDDVISVDVVGYFKPHPGIYRRAARILELEVGECMMVSAHPFDIIGSRACGYRAAFVDRYRFPYGDPPYEPDIRVEDFTGLADALL